MGIYNKLHFIIGQQASYIEGNPAVTKAFLKKVGDRVRKVDSSF
jgi:hypothetical protein